MTGSAILEDNSTDHPPSQSGGVTLLELLIVIVVVFLLSCSGILNGLVLFIFPLLTGWFFYLARVLPSITVSMEQTRWFLICLFAFITGLHFLLKKYYLANQKSSADSVEYDATPAWKKRWTGSISVLLLALIVTGICVIGVTHQVWWMATGDAPTFSFSIRQRQYARRMHSKQNLKQLGLAFHHYHHDNGQLPPGGTLSQTGQPQHSWATRLLPYLDQSSLYNQIDFEQPWTAEVNRDCFQTVVKPLLNPQIPMTSDQGYQPSHYAANSKVLNIHSGLNFKEITDGLSSTIIAGEVKSNLKAWGNPLNFRDPTLGINQSPHGFGSPYYGRAHILLGDGSVRFVSDKIDPAVLKALSTPNGGETVGDF